MKCNWSIFDWIIAASKPCGHLHTPISYLCIYYVRFIEPYKPHEGEEDDEFEVSIGHLGFRRLVTDLIRFERAGISIAHLDKCYLLGAGYDTAMPEILEYVRDDNPVDTPFPIFLSYRRFRTTLMKYLADLLMPTPPPGVCEGVCASLIAFLHLSFCVCVSVSVSVSVCL